MVDCTQYGYPTAEAYYQSVIGESKGRYLRMIAICADTGGFWDKAVRLANIEEKLRHAAYLKGLEDGRKEARG